MSASVYFVPKKCNEDGANRIEDFRPTQASATKIIEQWPNLKLVY